MAWYSFLTSSTKTVETATEAGKSIVDGLILGIDKIAYADEEKARRILAKLTFEEFFFGRRRGL